MALSNWDTVCLDESGKPTTGGFQSPMGVVVEVYKNWLYVRDEKGWRDGGHYVKPTVMQVTSGYVVYMDVQIVAWRGPQNGVYAVVWAGGFKEEVGIAAAGVYGYEDHEWVGVKQENVRWFADRIAHVETVFDEDGPYIPQKFKELDWAKALRFNQGDAYFARHLDADVPATPAGEPEKPIIESMLKPSPRGQEGGGS